MPPAPRKLHGKPWVELGDKRKWPQGRVPPNDPLENTRDHERIWLELSKLRRTAITWEDVGTGADGAAPVADFGFTPLLDDFNRADVAPMDNGWLQPFESTAGATVGLAGNLMKTTGLWEGSAYWPVSFGADQEAYATVKTDSHDLWIASRIVDPDTATRSFYRARYDDSDAATYLELVVNGTPSSPLGTYSHALVLDDRFGIRCLGDEISVYVSLAGGAWTQVIGVTDSSHNQPGYVGAYLYFGGQLDDFGGGEL